MRYLLYLCLLTAGLAAQGPVATDGSAVLPPVQTQLDAYSTGDLYLFLSAYADTVKIYSFPDQLTFSTYSAAW